VHWAAEMLESPGIPKNKDSSWNRDLITPNHQIAIICNPHKVSTAKVCRTQELTRKRQENLLMRLGQR
jgi:hypothetical protein